MAASSLAASSFDAASLAASSFDAASFSFPNHDLKNPSFLSSAAADASAPAESLSPGGFASDVAPGPASAGSSVGGAVRVPSGVPIEGSIGLTYERNNKNKQLNLLV